MNKLMIYGFSVLLTCLASTVNANDGDNIATLRHDTAIATQEATKAIAKVINTDVKQTRNYPMQPPVIPHTTRNYEVNLNSNKCMTCHSRERTQDSQAPMVSVTHFMDREGNFLAELSPRRYFCNQCHVNQFDAKPLIENKFIDMHTLTSQKASQQNNSAEHQ
ncbi:nitrate reductase cytochrome c-type subunit [Thalassotalea euphylliae]|uniref:Periplasmic nitrate reductase, electron transfer subunit n=1 Tax=Thalassotalea euphylliae TaxID=1655234 RepID=A0A3E0TMD2_9GAMM|nr:nitrate reductase cytochrome c-type subunit [Thalassotalea euphylliae]REL25714.1 nitrate reductase cytochrome c-type subunit [Thalassotalea euphylliae]